MAHNCIKLIECPRDAWQGLKCQIPTELKARYLRALIAAGFKHIDAVSFVSPKAVPQMADSEKVLEQIDVPTLEGKAHLKVTAGTQSGQMFKLRGKGIVNVNGRGHGDLFARLIVEVPSRLNGEQRRKLEEFAALCGEENTPIRKSFFEKAKEFFK